jgi:uncharacterized protein (DUF4415 family)
VLDMRVDRDGLEFLSGQGRGRQTKIDAAPRFYV